MAKERHRECTNCKTVHIIHRNFKDRSPTCYKCGGSSFTNVDNPKQIKGKCPIFCDWNLQHDVDNAAERVAEFIISRYKEKADPDMLSDFKQYLVLAANSSRRDFAFFEGFDKFSKPYKGVKRGN